MVDKPKWTINVPQELKYFPVTASLLFKSRMLGGLNDALIREFDFSKGLNIPEDLRDYIMRPSSSIESDLRHTMVRLGFFAQVINYLVLKGVERYIAEPENAGAGFSAAILTSKKLCSDIFVEAHGNANLVDSADISGYTGDKVILVHKAPKSKYIIEGNIFTFKADKEGEGKEGIFWNY